MLQFAMNSPGNVSRSSGFAGGYDESRWINRLLSLACFAVIALLHAAIFSGFGFFEKSGAPVTETRELSLTLDFAAPIPEEPAVEAAPELPLPAAVLPREEVPAAESEEIPFPLEETTETAAVAEPELSAAASFSGPAEGTLADAGDAALPALPASVGGHAAERTMSDAEYMALIMGRLEENKIYPLAVRKRGIEGDIMVNFTIKRDGSVSDMDLADPSGHRFLAQAAFETIRSSVPFPVMEGRNGDYTVRVSIRYQLED